MTEDYYIERYGDREFLPTTNSEQSPTMTPTNNEIVQSDPKGSSNNGNQEGSLEPVEQISDPLSPKSEEERNETPRSSGRRNQKEGGAIDEADVDLEIKHMENGVVNK